MGAMSQKFESAGHKSAGLADAFAAVAKQMQCGFFDAGTVTSTSRVDGVHLNAEQHERLGIAMADVVAQMLPVCAEEKDVS